MKRLGGWQLGVSLFSVDLNNILLILFVMLIRILSYPAGRRVYANKSQHEWHRKNENLITNRTNTFTNRKVRKVTVVGGKTLSLKC